MFKLACSKLSFGQESLAQNFYSIATAYCNNSMFNILLRKPSLKFSLFTPKTRNVWRVVSCDFMCKADMSMKPEQLRLLSVAESSVVDSKEKVSDLGVSPCCNFFAVACRDEVW